MLFIFVVILLGVVLHVAYWPILLSVCCFNATGNHSLPMKCYFGTVSCGFDDLIFVYFLSFKQRISRQQKHMQSLVRWKAPGQQTMTFAQQREAHQSWVREQVGHCGNKWQTADNQHFQHNVHTMCTAGLGSLLGLTYVCHSYFASFLRCLAQLANMSYRTVSVFRHYAFI